MLETTANEFRKTLNEKVDSCIKNYEVLKVKRRTGANFVILGEEDWRAREDTIYLNRVPSLMESIHLSAAEPIAEGAPLDEIEW